MKTLRLPIIASIAFAISACSGGGGSSPAPTTSVPSVNPQRCQLRRLPRLNNLLSIKVL